MSNYEPKFLIQTLVVLTAITINFAGNYQFTGPQFERAII